MPYRAPLTLIIHDSFGAYREDGQGPDLGNYWQTSSHGPLMPNRCGRSLSDRSRWVAGMSCSSALSMRNDRMPAAPGPA
jgi:hypothetical protein